METEKSENGNSEDQKANGHDSAPEEKKPIIDQMTDMLAWQQRPGPWQRLL